jgi:hypothetical protein
MNPNNYCTLKAAQRLAAAGIVMETEAVWYRRWDRSDLIELCLRSQKPLYVIYPAPCFAEVWRELPEDNGKLIVLIEQWLSETKEDWFHCDPELCVLEAVRDINLLVSLLIWVREKETR